MADTNNDIPQVNLFDGIEGYQDIDGQYSALDADTLVDTNDPSRTYRQPNINAPEVDKVILNKDTGNYEIKSGSFGGKEASDALVSLGTDLGFNKVSIQNEDQEAYGRGRAVRTNEYGQSFNNFLLSNGMIDPAIGASSDAALTSEFGRMTNLNKQIQGDDRHTTAVKIVKDLVDAQYGDDPRIKKIAYDELEYATRGGSDYFQPFTAVDSYDKNLDNTAVNPLLTAGSVGIESVVGGLYGAAYMLGDVTGLDKLKDFGVSGAYRSAQDMQEFGKFKSDFEDVEDFSDALEFLGTNIAMSIPQMGATIGALALAPVTKGASLTLPVSIYSGQVWNEQPTDKKNALSATTAGVLMASLDALGVKGIGKVATKGAPKEVFDSALKTLMSARPQLSAAEAKDILLQQSRLNIAKLAGNAGDIARDQLRKRNLFVDSVGRVLQSGAIEGGTEAIQEMIGYIGANHDNPAFDFGEMQERMIKAGITGGALGGSFGAVGAVGNIGGWVDANWKMSEAREKNLSDAGKASVKLQEEGVDVDLESNIDTIEEEAVFYGDNTALDIAIENNIDGAPESKDGLAISDFETVIGKVKSGLDVAIEKFRNPDKPYEFNIDDIPEEGIEVVVGEPSVDQSLFDFEEDGGFEVEIEPPESEFSVEVEPTAATPTPTSQTIKVTKAQAVDYINGTKIDPLAVQHKKILDETPTGKKILMGLKAFPSYFFKGAVAFAIPPSLRERSNSARLLFDMFGGGNQTTYSGFSFEEFKSDLVAQFRNSVMDADKFYELITKRKVTSPKLRAELGRQLHKLLATATIMNRKATKEELKQYFKDDIPGFKDDFIFMKDDKGNNILYKKGRFDPSLLDQDNYILTFDGGTVAVSRDVLINFGNELEALSNKMYKMQARWNSNIGYLPNYLARFKTLNKIAIEENRQGFIDALIEHTGVSADIANDVTDSILNNSEVNTLDGLMPDDTNDFSVTKGGVVPGSHKKRSVNMAESDLFNEFMEQDIFRNVAESAKQSARYIAYSKYVGKNASKIGVLLKRMIAEGVPEAEVNRTAKYLKDYLDAESGNYNRPEEAFGKTLAGAQKSAILLSTIVYLPLATVSSIVELALIFRGLDNKQIFDEKTGIKAIAKQMANSIWQGINEVGSMTTGKPNKAEGTLSQRRMKELGYYSWDVGAATTTGVTEVSATRQRVLEAFFKVNLLQGFTQITRAMRLSYAYDYLSDHISIVVDYNPNDRKTNEVQASEEALRNLGLNIDDIRRIFGNLQNDQIRGVIDPEVSKRRSDELESMLRLAETRFVNEASMLPTGNKVPFFYQDPRFALFNQFQGFIAMFTSTFIPKLWGEYVKRGSPAMKYNAFATMAGMILLGFVSQDLKDRLKYGETSPYLDDLEYVRRGLASSGLLGTTERFADTLFPIYESRSDNTAEWMYDQIVGQSPSLGFVDTGRDAIATAVKGEGEKSIDKALKLTPIGVFTSARREVANKIANDWNPFGD